MYINELLNNTFLISFLRVSEPVLNQWNPWHQPRAPN